MNFKALVRNCIAVTGYTLTKVSTADGTYDEDGLRSIHNHDFMQDPAFRAAYDRGCRAAKDYKFHWRAHIALWAAATAIQRPGDFVECGVNRGFMSSAIMKFLDWNSRDRIFYLLDTFEGIDPDRVSDEDRANGVLARNATALQTGFYVRDVASVAANFAEWKNARIVQGSIPDTLDRVESKQIAYLHLDMNCSPPEIAAITHFWDRLVPGAVVLLDDYAYKGYEPQKRAMDEFARTHGVMIASLPTGQGLILKP